MDKEKELYLWEFSTNLCVAPQRVKVVKECPKTFWIDSVFKKVNKVSEPDSQGCVGYTQYCLYYDTEENAIISYNRLKKEQDERRRFSSREYIKKQAVKEFAKKLKECQISVRGIKVVTVKQIDILFNELYDWWIEQ